MRARAMKRTQAIRMRCLPAQARLVTKKTIGRSRRTGRWVVAL